MAGPLFPASLLQESWGIVGPLVVHIDAFQQEVDAVLIGDPVLIGDGLPTAAWRLEVGISRVRAGGVASVLVGNGLQDCGTDLIVALAFVGEDVAVDELTAREAVASCWIHAAASAASWMQVTDAPWRTVMRGAFVMAKGGTVAQDKA